MKALDSNVLVRFLVKDDAAQVARARRLFVQATAGGPLHVSCVVVAEMVWVLESAYSLGREEIIDALEMLLQARELEFEEKDRVRAAMRDFALKLGALSDCLIGQLGLVAGCEATVTFDRGLRRNPAFEQL